MRISLAAVVVVLVAGVVAKDCMYDVYPTTLYFTTSTRDDLITNDALKVQAGTVTDANQACSDDANCDGILESSDTPKTQVMSGKYALVSDDTYNQEIMVDGSAIGFYSQIVCSNTELDFEDAETATNYCPASTSRRLVQCSYASDSDGEAACIANDRCCWDAAGDIQCTMSILKQCTVPTSVSFDSQNVLMTHPTGGNANIYPEESVTFICQNGKKFIGDTVVDSDSETQIKCLVSQTDGKVTDIETTYNKMQCKIPCTPSNLNVDAATSTVNIDLAQDYRLDSTYTLSCVSGYGFNTGTTDKDLKCQNSAITDSCYSCTIDAPPSGAGYSVTGPVMPGTVVTVTCDEGYSLGQGVSDTGLCGDPYDSVTMSECKEDCVLTLITSGDTAHTVTPASASTTSLAYGESVTLACLAGSLPADQEEILTCNTAGGELVPEACHPLCNVEDSSGIRVTNQRNVLLQGSDGSYALHFDNSPTTQVVLNTNFRVSCDTSYALEVGTSIDFQCSAAFYNFVTDQWPGIPECYAVCLVSTKDSVSDYTVTVGDEVVITSGTAVPHGTSIRGTCVNELFTVVESELATQELTCDDIGTNINIKNCALPCEKTYTTTQDSDGVYTTTTTSDGPTENTIISPGGTKVGAGQAVTFTCPAGYSLGGGGGLTTTEETGAVMCNDAVTAGTYAMNPTTVATTSSCYANPIISNAAPNGQQIISVTVSLPSDYDRTLSIVKKVTISAVVTGSSSAVASHELTTPELDGFTASTPEATIELSGLGIDFYTINVEVFYIAVDSSTTKTVTQADVRAGPDALTGLTVTAVGKGKITINADASTASLDQLGTDYSDIYYKVEIADESNANIIATLESLSKDELTAELSITGLLEETPFQVKVTSMIPTGPGGTSTFASFTTGLDSPLVTAAIASSTTAVLTINIPGKSDFTGTLTVKIVDGSTETSHDLDFTAGVATITITGLEPLSENTRTITVMSAGVPSDSTTVSFSQGPTEPTIALARTTDTITASWTSVSANTYHLILTSDGAEIATGTTTQGTFTFGLSTDYSISRGTLYTVSITAEMTLSGDPVSSTSTSESITTYHCALTDKTDVYDMYYSVDGAKGTEVLTEYIVADSNTKFYVECAKSTDSFPGIEENIDHITACTGSNVWETHTNCEETSVPSGVSSVVLGLVIAIVIVVCLIIIVIIVINVRKGNTSKRSKQYSPRDEEQNNEKGSPDIPDNKHRNGDNVSRTSQEARLDFQDDDAPDAVVIGNDNVYDNPDNNA